MNLEPVMQELLGDASSIVAAYQQAEREQERFIKVQIAVAQALNQVGTAAGMAEDKIEEMTQRVIGSTNKMNEILGKASPATKDQLKVIQAEAEMWAKRKKEMISSVQSYVSSSNQSQVESGIPGFGSPNAQKKFADDEMKRIQDLRNIRSKWGRDYIDRADSTRGADILRREMSKSAKEYSLAQETADTEENKKRGEKAGRGFGRWWAAGAAMQIGSQLGPIGTLGGDIIGGGLIGGPAGAGIGAIVGVVQVGINAFKAFADIGHTTLMSIAGAAEVVTHKFMTLTEEIVKAGMKMESDRVKFEVLAQIAERGDILFSGLQGMSTTTPFSVNQLSDTTDLLLGMGRSVEDILPTLGRLGDLAAGDSDRLVRLARVMEQVGSEGRITGFRLRALANLGIGAKDIADTMGLSMPEAMDKLKSGKVADTVLIDVFNKLTSEGGRFFDMTSRSLNTVSGQWNRLTNIVELMKGKMGEALLTRFDAVGKIQYVVDFLERNAKEIQDIFLAVWDRIMAAADVLWEALKAGWQGVMKSFGMSGKSFLEILPSVDQIREGMKELITLTLKFTDILLTAVGAFIDMKMLSFSIDVAMLRVSSWFLTGSEALTGDAKKTVDSLIQAYDTIGPRVKESLENTRKIIRQGLGDISKAVEDEATRSSTGPAGISAKGRGNPLAGLTIIRDINAGTATKQYLELAQIKGGGSNLDLGFGKGGLGPDGLEERMKELMGKGPSRLSVNALEELTKLTQTMETGILPLEKFTNKMKLFDELIYGPQFPGDFIGPPAPQSQAQIEKAQRGSFLEFANLEKSVKGLDERLPRAMLAGSADAQDTINRGMYQQQSVQERIEEVLERTKEEAKIYYEQFTEFKKWLMEGKFVKEG